VTSLAEPVRRRAHRISSILLFALLVFLGIHAFGAIRDFIVAIHYPYELDYGEGIVWQQAALIPGPRMYAPGAGLPFIAFQYPPLFYLVTRVVATFMPDLLSAGRLVSATAALSIVPLIGMLVIVAAPRSFKGRTLTAVTIAAAAGLLALSLHAVRTWGLFMRVDMIAVALGLAGVGTAAWSNGKLWGTTCGLLLCVASVYCKQTQLPAGIAIFLIVLLRRPRAALGAAAVAAATGLAVLGLLQWLTSGGFLENIIGYNVNRLAWVNLEDVFWPERTSFLFMLLIPIAAYGVFKSVFVPAAEGIHGRLHVRLADRATAARAMLLLHFALASLMLGTAFKSGGDFNYLLDWLCVGSVLIGVWLCDILCSERCFAAVVGLMIMGLLFLPVRQMPDVFPQPELDRQAALVRRIAEAVRPVASENMTLLMRAGKPVIFEPAIVTELASLARWNEQPLVHMIDSRGFAFMITTDDVHGATPRRTPAIDAAMRRAYPRVEQASPALWLHLPPQ
jgi:hypothetical protein